eukprot:3806124-Amphidinium_carterae.1
MVCTEDGERKMMDFPVRPPHYAMGALSKALVDDMVSNTDQKSSKNPNPLPNYPFPSVCR